MVERLYRRLKDSLRARGAANTWAAELSWVLLGLRSTPREDTNISPAQALYGTSLVLPNQYLSINNEQTMNEFIIQIDNILKNLPMTRHNTAADKERTCPRSCGPRIASGSTEVATCRPSRPSTTAPTPSSSAASATSSLQLGDREDNVSTARLKPCTGGAAVPISGTDRRPSASASTLRPCHRQRQLTLEPFFLASLPGFFARPGEASSSRNPHCNRGPPAWQLDYTFFAANRNQEAWESSVGTPRKGCLRPSSQHESSSKREGVEGIRRRGHTDRGKTCKGTL
jgi:hypothetical protein